jgi:hypothetical protein
MVAVAIDAAGNSVVAGHNIALNNSFVPGPYSDVLIFRLDSSGVA